MFNTQVSNITKNSFSQVENKSKNNQFVQQESNVSKSVDHPQSTRYRQ